MVNIYVFSPNKQLRDKLTFGPAENAWGYI